MTGSKINISASNLDQRTKLIFNPKIKSSTKFRSIKSLTHSFRINKRKPDSKLFSLKKALLPKVLNLYAKLPPELNLRDNPLQTIMNKTKVIKISIISTLIFLISLRKSYQIRNKAILKVIQNFKWINNTLVHHTGQKVPLNYHKKHFLT